MTLPDDTALDASTDDPAVPRHGRLWLAAFGALIVCTNLGTIFTARLVESHPAVLLALSSRNRNLILTVPSDLGWLLWASVGVLRLSVAAVVCHMLGRCYGDRALRLFWRYLGMPPEQVTSFENGFAKAEWLVVPFFVGSNIVWVLSGAARTTWKRLVPLAAVGLAARLALLWWLAKRFNSQVQSVIDFTAKYQWWFIIGGLVVVIATQMRNFRRGG